MTSFEKRFLSYKKFTPSSIPINKLTSACFISETPTSCLCIYCKKALDNWDPLDDPLTEHYIHQKTCPLFSLNLLESRCKTYPPNFDAKRKKELAKQGFIYYKLKEKPGYDLFCYKCGFYLNNRTGIPDSHLIKCTKRKRCGKFDIDNKNNLFYLDLLAGKIRVEDYCFQNVYVPDNLKDKFMELVENVEGVFGQVNEVLKDRIHSLYVEEDKFVDNEIENIMKMIDKRFDEKVKDLGNIELNSK